jgi:isopentenyl diphosphate isomerase/L-lactate dehydrogenase-like FMN-dependent dehydrogenase
MIKQPPPLQELVNLLEVEAAARQKLAPALFAEIAGSDRTPFERMTFRPRLMVNTMKLDLSVELLGEKLFAPIIVGPVANLGRFHPEGEVAMARGASAARAAMLLAADRSRPMEQIAAAAKTPLWVADGASIHKGILTPDAAKAALDRGAKAIVVSAYGGAGRVPAMEALPVVVDAVAGRVPVLVDGSFRRGTDVLKALAFGAKAVLIARPVAWGLAAYGADGVQHVIELLRGELARAMVMCGKAKLADLDRGLVKIHRW